MLLIVNTSLSLSFQPSIPFFTSFHSIPFKGIGWLFKTNTFLRLNARSFPQQQQQQHIIYRAVKLTAKHQAKTFATNRLCKSQVIPFRNLYIYKYIQNFQDQPWATAIDKQRMVFTICIISKYTVHYCGLNIYWTAWITQAVLPTATTY